MVDSEPKKRIAVIEEVILRRIGLLGKEPGGGRGGGRAWRGKFEIWREEMNRWIDGNNCHLVFLPKYKNH